MNNINNAKLVFAPGCFDNFDGTQEELDELIKGITEAFESGELLENSEKVDLEELAQDEPELYQQLVKATDPTNPSRNLQ
jgi:hypothetical protein